MGAVFCRRRLDGYAHSGEVARLDVREIPYAVAEKLVRSPSHLPPGQSPPDLVAHISPGVVPRVERDHSGSGYRRDAGLQLIGPFRLTAQGVLSIRGPGLWEHDPEHCVCGWDLKEWQEVAHPVAQQVSGRPFAWRRPGTLEEVNPLHPHVPNEAEARGR